MRSHRSTDPDLFNGLRPARLIRSVSFGHSKNLSITALERFVSWNESSFNCNCATSFESDPTRKCSTPAMLGIDLCILAMSPSK